jgi:AcrR family transcriptional regulator
MAQTYHHGALKKALLKSGLDIIQKDGAAGLTLSRVAKLQGVSAAAVYRHYSSKEELLAAIGAQGFRKLRKALDKNLSKPPSDARLFFRRSVEAYIDIAMTMPRHYELMFGGLIPEHQRFVELHSAGQEAFSSLIASIEYCQQAGLFRKRKPIIMAMYIWSMMHGFVMLQISGQNPLPARNLRQIRSQVGVMVQMLRRGLDSESLP